MIINKESTISYLFFISKLAEWFAKLKNEEGYDVVILLARTTLMYFTGLTELNKYSYGFSYDENIVFSLNTIIVFWTKNGKEFYRTTLHGFSDYIGKVKDYDLCMIPLNDVTKNDLQPALERIYSINKNMGIQVCKAIEKKVK